MSKLLLTSLNNHDISFIYFLFVPLLWLFIYLYSFQVFAIFKANMAPCPIPLPTVSHSSPGDDVMNDFNAVSRDEVNPISKSLHVINLVSSPPHREQITFWCYQRPHAGWIGPPQPTAI